MAERTFLRRAAHVPVIQENPGIELLLLQTQEEPVEVVCIPSEDDLQVLLRL